MLVTVASDPPAAGEATREPQGRGRRPDDVPARVTPGRIARHPLTLWVTFVLVHLVLGLVNSRGDWYAMSDVTGVYRYWVEQGFAADYWVGIDAPWVYPIAAIVPMLIASVAGPSLYASTWLSLVLVLDLVALGFITGWGRRADRLAIGWWWTLFLAALGPIALGRIDSIAVAVSIVGVLLLASRPRAAAMLFTVAAWIKVWPGALVVAMVTVMSARWRVLTVAVGTSAFIAGLALSFGSGTNVLSFVTEQTGRGLQVEAPVSTFWMWQAAAGVPGATVYYDTDILTWQVTGRGVSLASEVMTPLLVLVVLAVVLLALLARRAGAEALAVMPPLALALVTGMIAFQKVGSPQFVGWVAVPVIFGLVSHRAGLSASFRVPAVLVVVLAALTQLVYPTFYAQVLGLDTGMLSVLTARNLLTVALFGWSLVALWRMTGRTAVPAASVPAASARRAPARRASARHAVERTPS